MSENHVQIRRGSGAPNNGALQPYELGFDHQNRILYINTDKLDYTLTDLTGTTWEINENLVLAAPTFTYNVNFTDKTNESYESLLISSRTGDDYFNVKNQTISSLNNTYWWGIDGASTQLYDTSTAPIEQLSTTTWTFKDSISLTSIDYNINFTKAEPSSTDSYVRFRSDGNSLYYYYNSSTYITVYSNTTGWASSSNQSITITGGNAVANTSFITWLKQNAILSSATFSARGSGPYGSYSQITLTPNELILGSNTVWYNGHWYGMPIRFIDTDEATHIISYSYFINWIKTNALKLQENTTYYTLDYDNNIKYTYKNYSKSWSGNNAETREKTRIITFTSGTDITNSNLITWLQNNATLKSTPPQYENIKLLQYNSQDGSYLPLSAGSDNPLTNILYINLSNDGTQAQSTGIHIQHNGVNRGTLYQYCYENGSANPDFLALAGRNKSGSQVNGIRFFDSGSVVLFGGTNTITLRPNGASSTSGQVNLATNGTLTVSGDIRRTAKTYSATQTASKSLSSGNTKICGITGIEAGVYLINAYVHMAMTGGGNAYINLYKATNNTSAICYDNHYVKAGSSYFTTTTWATFAASGNLSLYIEVTASCSVDNVVLSMIRIA